MLLIMNTYSTVEKTTELQHYITLHVIGVDMYYNDLVYD